MLESVTQELANGGFVGNYFVKKPHFILFECVFYMLHFYFIFCEKGQEDSLMARWEKC